MRRMWDPLLQSRAHMEARSAAVDSGATASAGTAASKIATQGDPQCVLTKSQGVS